MGHNSFAKLFRTSQLATFHPNIAKVYMRAGDHSFGLKRDLPQLKDEESFSHAFLYTLDGPFGRVKMTNARDEFKRYQFLRRLASELGYTYKRTGGQPSQDFPQGADGQTEWYSETAWKQLTPDGIRQQFDQGKAARMLRTIQGTYQLDRAPRTLEGSSGEPPIVQVEGHYLRKCTDGFMILVEGWVALLPTLQVPYHRVQELGRLERGQSLTALVHSLSIDPSNGTPTILLSLPHHP